MKLAFANTMALIAFTAILQPKIAIAQSEWEYFDASKWGARYLKKGYEKSEFGSSIEMLVQIDNPSKFPPINDIYHKPSSIVYEGGFTCGSRTRTFYWVTLYSNIWATGRILARVPVNDNGYVYSEQEWKQKGYEEKFCKKPKRFGLF
ncbi:MAG: hypothetical protein EBU08_17410 [Micrococcales bacterium]|nr:hypothetical protein [Micrococcales bacterium]